MKPTMEKYPRKISAVAKQRALAAMTEPARAAEYQSEWSPSPAIPSSAPVAGGDPPQSSVPSAADFSPPLIAMVAVLGAAFLIVLYARVLSRQLHRLRRQWRRHRRLLQSTAVSDFESPYPAGGLGGGVFSFGSSSDFFLSPYGLDEEAIRALPLSLFSKAKAKHLASLNRDCAVCLLEFEDEDTLRTLPLCSHAFHVDCIDVWLRSHATCPLCRAAVLRQDSPFIPLRASRIRPSFDDLLLDPLPLPALANPESEIVPASADTPPSIRDRIAGRDFLLKRSYSFGFERSLAADRMVLEASTASPWRYRQRSFWSKRWPSPFAGAGGGSSSASRAARVFSFRSYRGGNGVKSPFLRRRGFFPLSSESAARFSGAGASSSSRRSRSMTSPSAIFMRPAMAVGFSSSRMRCGDPEALLSPERFGDRR